MKNAMFDAKYMVSLLVHPCPLSNKKKCKKLCYLSQANDKKQS